MRLYYFPDMPIDEVQPLSTVARPELYDTPDDPTKQIKISRKTWKNLYGADILESLREHGQLNPCLVSWYPEHGQWLVDPGEARWDAMKELGWETFRVLLKARPGNRCSFFRRHEHRELRTMPEVAKLFKSAGKVRNLNGLDWFRKTGWALPDTEGDRVAVG